MEKRLEEISQVWQMWYFWIHTTIQGTKNRNRLATEVWATGNSEAAVTTQLNSRLKEFYKESYTMEVCIEEGGPNTVPYLSSENIVRNY